ncbi:reverse transcriptase domain, reverse transcriptase zinc-binding domain protein, partial [Tanacetum coccineum]
WKNGFGIVKQFSMQTVWNDIRPRGVKVDWRLKTQDKLRAWDHVDWSNLTCALCELQPDSHEHLFFDCVFSQQVWSRVKDLAGLPNSVPSIDDILHDISPFAKKRTSKSIVAKLVVDAAAYFIWQERNGRLFKESKLSVSQIPLLTTYTC